VDLLLLLVNDQLNDVYYVSFADAEYHQRVLAFMTWYLTDLGALILLDSFYSE